MEKYHPVHSKKREDLALAGVKKRLEVWQQLESQIPVCVEESSKLEAFLDQVVAKLEHREEDKEGDDGLHKTSSIFLKTLPANITREELEEICKKFPGFLRVCLSDPVPAKKWQRKAWVTFKENTKVREICYSLNNTKIRGCELSSLVNKPLSQRIRSVPVLNCDGKVARGHILLASKIVANLDLQRGLWQGGKNPVLENIQDFLVEEVSAEEEELLGKTTTENQDEASKSEEEPAVLAALDRILVYLRVVHSVDFYTGAEYKSEEEMPNKCGIFHVRPKFPEDLAVSQADVQTLLTSSEKSLAGVLKPTIKLTDTEAGKLGLKTESDEVEKFIGSNCQEVAQDKWLCPLSGKKFKGPDYIRKHIVNKFPERLEEVKQDTAFFNNYLRDPSRPELPIIQGVRYVDFLISADHHFDDAPFHQLATFNPGQAAVLVEDATTGKAKMPRMGNVNRLRFVS